MAAVLELLGLSRTYPGPPAVPALRHADLTLLAGDYLAVVGPSGSGKSTLLNLLGLLDRPTGGTLRLDGIDTASLSEGARTALRGRRIGFVFQAFHLLPYRSATENVALAQVYTGAHPQLRRTRAREALSRVSLGHRLDAMPTTLSGGERQRVAIARALVNQPSLLLCDEPTGNLDSHTSGAVLDVLDDLNVVEGVTIVMITHDPQVAGRARRVVTIRDGVLSDA
jgi:putative ABC transport system ATP-binding protein